MTLIVDAVIVGLIVVGALIGASRGFIRSVSKPVRILCALLTAFLFASPVGTTVIQPTIEAPVMNQIADFLTDKCDVITTENVPTIIKFAASICDADLDRYMGSTAEESATKIAEAVAEPTARILSSVLSFVLLYIGISLIIAFVFFVLDKTFSGGSLGVVNRFLGFVVSGAFSFIVVWVLCSVFTFVISMPLVRETQFADAFVPGKIYSFFRDLDPVRLLLSF